MRQSVHLIFEENYEISRCTGFLGKGVCPRFIYDETLMQGFPEPRGTSVERRG